VGYSDLYLEFLLVSEQGFFFFLTSKCLVLWAMFTKCKISWGSSKTRGVSHGGLAVYIEKYLKAKDMESWKLKYFHHEKSTILKKYCKRNQNPSRYYYNSITNLNFQHKPKYHLSKVLV
jgi:hypothetical protein